MSVHKSGAYTSESRERPFKHVGSALLANIRQGWEGLPGTNILAYLANLTVMLVPECDSYSESNKSLLYSALETFFSFLSCSQMSSTYAIL
jgi:hypothetical protein